jgi:hypothetical protein
VVTFYVSYLMPIYLGARTPGWQKAAVWNLGKYSRLVGYTGLLWGAFIFIVLVMPPNVLAGKSLAALSIILSILYFARARHQYHGPEWAKSYLEEMRSSRATEFSPKKTQAN